MPRQRLIKQALKQQRQQERPRQMYVPMHPWCSRLRFTHLVFTTESKETFQVFVATKEEENCGWRRGGRWWSLPLQWRRGSAVVSQKEWFLPVPPAPSLNHRVCLACTVIWGEIIDQFNTLYCRYIQVFFTFFIAATLVYIITSFLLTVHRDFRLKREEHSQGVFFNIASICRRTFTNTDYRTNATNWSLYKGVHWE